jgi:hypothetical protein
LIVEPKRIAAFIGKGGPTHSKKATRINFPVNFSQIVPARIKCPVKLFTKIRGAVEGKNEFLAFSGTVLFLPTDSQLILVNSM